MRAGPKPAVDSSPLPLRGSRRRELAVARFVADYIRVPRGHGVRKPLRLRPWQRALIASTWDQRPQPRIVGWMLPRGQGKTSLTAVLALYELLAGPDGAQVVVVATDERQAGLCHRQASRMVELHPDLEGRVQQYADALTVPARGSSFQVLPAVPKRLEGLDYTLAIVDEAGRVDQEVYEVVALATGKQRGDGGAGDRDARPRAGEHRPRTLRTYALDHPDDPLVVWREHSAAGFEDHPVDYRHCWELSNPALNDFLAEDGLIACLPPKMREASFRRARLYQLTDQLEDAWLPPLRVGCRRRCDQEHPGRGRSRVGVRWQLQRRHQRHHHGHRRPAAPYRPRGAVGAVADATGSRGRRRAGHQAGVPPLAGPGDRCRPVPLGAFASLLDGEGLPVLGTRSPRADDAGHGPVLRGRGQRPAHPLG
jgi:Terminase large subunit, ATPase domain